MNTKSNELSVRDKTILVTGGAGGIGRETALEIVRRGGYAVAVDLPGKKSPSGLEFIEADLSSRGGIRKMVEEFSSNHAHLDALVNNAGAIFPERLVTDDGVEATFALNHLSYFASTLLLLDRLKRSSLPAVINVSSSHYRAGRMNFDDLQFERDYDMNRAYCQSKLANLLFTLELSERLRGEQIRIATIHPGAVESGFGDPLRGFWRFMWRVSRPLRRSPKEVGEEVTNLLESPALLENSGGYYVKGKARKTLPRANDRSAARRLWAESLELATVADVYVDS